MWTKYDDWKLDNNEQEETEKSNALDLKCVEVVEMENVNIVDYPEFCDAYISKANYHEGGTVRELTEDELEKINEDYDFVYNNVINYLF